MKLYKYWVKEPCHLQVDDAPLSFSLWGGSNVSLEDARAKARDKFSALKDRIERRTPRTNDDYEVEIREEIIEEINSRNIVSRNRYGARVLNSEDTVFIDIDQFPIPWWMDLKAIFSFKRLSQTDALIQWIHLKSRRPAYEGLTFRLYATRKGFRLIVTGRVFDPRSKETKKLFEDFSADSLYAQLCRKQNCFRARLTPKPHRIRCKGHKVIYPRTEAEQTELDAWLQRYTAASARFGVCRFIQSIGAGGNSSIISYHDSATQALKTLKLA